MGGFIESSGCRRRPIGAGLTSLSRVRGTRREIAGSRWYRHSDRRRQSLPPSYGADEPPATAAHAPLDGTPLRPGGRYPNTARRFTGGF